MSFVNRALREAAKDFDYERTVSVVRQVAPDRDSMLYLCAGLLEVAAADGEIDRDELVAITSIMDGLGFSEKEREDFLRSTLGGNEEDERTKALNTLGLEEGASDYEIKKAYRRNAAKYHPDKLAHLGAEFSDVAHQKFIEVTSAYEHLKAARNER